MKARSWQGYQLSNFVLLYPSYSCFLFKIWMHGCFKVVLDSLFMQVAIIDHLNIDWQSEAFLLCFPDLWFF